MTCTKKFFVCPTSGSAIHPAKGPRFPGPPHTTPWRSGPRPSQPKKFFFYFLVGIHKLKILAPFGSAWVILKPRAYMKEPRVSASKYWFFTFNNYSAEEAESIALCFDEKCDKYVMQEEVGSVGSNKHLQGKVCLRVKGRPLEVFKDFKKIHWEKSKMWDGWEYCAKDDTHVGRRWSKGVVIPKPLKINEPYGWQLKVMDIISGEPDDRVIHWFWSARGRVGKTHLVKYLMAKHDALLINGKACDMKCAIALMMQNKKPLPEICIMNIPRSVDHISYMGMEEIKDGAFFSGKYESGSILMNPPHFLVFANREPEYEKLSDDRWKVYDIEELMTLECHEVLNTEPHSPQ